MAVLGMETGEFEQGAARATRAWNQSFYGQGIDGQRVNTSFENILEGIESTGDALITSAKKAEPLAVKLKEMFSRHGEVAQGLHFIAGSGVAIAVGLLAREFSHAATEIHKVAREFHEGKASAEEMSLVLTDMVPLAGHVVRGIVSIVDVIKEEALGYENAAEHARKLADARERLKAGNEAVDQAGGRVGKARDAVTEAREARQASEAALAGDPDSIMRAISARAAARMGEAQRGARDQIEAVEERLKNDKSPVAQHMQLVEAAKEERQAIRDALAEREKQIAAEEKLEKLRAAMELAAEAEAKHRAEINELSDAAAAQQAKALATAEEQDRQQREVDELRAREAEEERDAQLARKQALASSAAGIFEQLKADRDSVVHVAPLATRGSRGEADIELAARRLAAPRAANDDPKRLAQEAVRIAKDQLEAQQRTAQLIEEALAG